MSNILTIDTKSSALVEEHYDILPLYDENHPMLSMKLEEFDFNNAPAKPSKIAGDLLATMRAYNGIGLSANQCGLPFRVFVMEPNFVCFNPRVVAMEGVSRDKEGCLSFPGLWLYVDRPMMIEAEYEIASGVTTKHRFEGLTARCFMHELDHMNGIKYTTYVGKTSLQMARQRQVKFIKKVSRNMKNTKHENKLQISV
jgi:peptide deformylase